MVVQQFQFVCQSTQVLQLLLDPVGDLAQRFLDRGAGQRGLPHAVARRHSALEEDGPAELREEVGRGDPAADDGLAPHPHQRHLGDVVVDDVPEIQM